MWKCISRAKEPPKKKCKQDYEQHRTPRTFREDWKIDRAWLRYEASCNAMFCDVCLLSDKKNEFTKESGCQSFRVETVKIHEKSEIHRHAVEVQQNKEKKVGERPAEKALQKLNTEIFSKLTLMFRTAHAMAINNRPFSDFSWMCKLDQKKGHLGVDIGATYHNDKSCRVFTQAIAMAEREKIKTEIESSKYVSILCDGSMDSAVIDNEIIYMRYVVSGVPKVKFLGCMQVSKADAKGIVDAMSRACTVNELSWNDLLKKMIALGSDGASVMLGKKRGVAAILRESNNSSALLWT